MIKFLMLISVAAGYSQSNDDSLAIKSASMDYVEGWYQADAERMARSLHPDLVKPAVRTLKKSGRPVAEISIHDAYQKNNH